MITALSQVTYDTRQRMASENPYVLLPCCWHRSGEGCANDASHWLLSTRGGAWQVVDALPAEAKQSPPAFCQQHAESVAEQRNAAQPSPMLRMQPGKSKKEKRP